MGAQGGKRKTNYSVLEMLEGVISPLENIPKREKFRLRRVTFMGQVGSWSDTSFGR